MNENPTVTYIKDGQENNIKHFFKYFFERDVVNIKRDKILNKTFYKFKDIEYIHIKNFEFSSKDSICLELLNKNTTIILENCIFNAPELTIKDYKKIGENNNNYLQIVNSIFKKECELNINNLKNVDIVLSEEGENIELQTGCCENISITCSSKLKKISNFKTTKIHIKNLISKNLKYFYSDSYALLLENSKIENYNLYNNEIHLINSSINTKSDLIFIYLKKLILENSSITSSKSILSPYLEELKFNDSYEDTILDTSSYIKAGENIVISTSAYHKKNYKNNGAIIVNKETIEKDSYLLKNKLISILKELNNEKLEKPKIKKRVNNNE